MLMRILRNHIEVTEFDAVCLLEPDSFPVSEDVYAAVALQADELINAEAEDIRDEYQVENSGLPLNKYLLDQGDIIGAVYNGIYERLSARADFGKFVEDGIITRDTRSALFCYRPLYSLADTCFSVPRQYAGDLIPFYEALKVDHVRTLTDEQLSEGASEIERDHEFKRYSSVVRRLLKIAEPNLSLYDIPVNLPEKGEPKALTIIKNWASVILAQA